MDCTTPMEEQNRRCGLWGVERVNWRRLCKPRSWGSKAERRMAKFTAQAQWIMWVVSDDRLWYNLAWRPKCSSAMSA